MFIPRKSLRLTSVTNLWFLSDECMKINLWMRVLFFLFKRIYNFVPVELLYQQAWWRRGGTGMLPEAGTGRARKRWTVLPTPLPAMPSDRDYEEVHFQEYTNTWNSYRGAAPSMASLYTHQWMYVISDGGDDTKWMTGRYVSILKTLYVILMWLMMNKNS